MGFNFDKITGYDFNRSLLMHAQGRCLGILYSNRFLKRLYGDNLAWKIAMTFFYFSAFIDISRYIFLEEYRKNLFDPYVIFTNTWIFILYIWIYFKYKYLVANKKDTSIGLKVINSESYINLRWIMGFGFYTNLSLLFTPISLIFAFRRLFEEPRFFIVLEIIESIVFVLITIPSFVFLYIENPEQTYYAKAKNKVKSLLEHQERKPVLLPVSS